METRSNPASSLQRLKSERGGQLVEFARAHLIDANQTRATLGGAGAKPPAGAVEYAPRGAKPHAGGAR